MDTLAPLSMKSVARYEKSCELQNKRITNYSNAHCASLPKERQFSLRVDHIPSSKKECFLHFHFGVCTEIWYLWIYSNVSEFEILSCNLILKNAMLESKIFLNCWISLFHEEILSLIQISILLLSTSDESRLPPEFKHIIKGRKRKQQWFH